MVLLEEPRLAEVFFAGVAVIEANALGPAGFGAEHQEAALTGVAAVGPEEGQQVFEAPSARTEDVLGLALRTLADISHDYLVSPIVGQKPHRSGKFLLLTSEL